MLAAIICEYDPFHNGHKYLIEETRRRTGCDGVVCIMSGSFTQRGRPAVCDKWARAEMAVAGGADAVIELPFMYAVASAQFFARGAVSICRQIGAKYLAFGAASSLEVLQERAEELTSPEYEKALKAALKAGKSYPRAAAQGAQADPNDILAAEYLAELRRSGAEIEPVAVERIGPAHGSSTVEGSFASASQIRKLMQKPDWESRIVPYVPETTLKILKNWRSGDEFITAAQFDTLVSGTVRRMNSSELESLPFGNGGVANLVMRSAAQFSRWDEITEASVSRSYPAARINRFLTHAICDLRGTPAFGKKEIDRLYGTGANKFSGVPYVRVLAVAARPVLSRLAEGISRANESDSEPCTLVLSPREYISDPGHGAKLMLQDVQAQSVYASALRAPGRADSGRDYTENVFRNLN